MKSTRSPTEFDQNNRDVTSIPGYVIKKNRSRGAKHGASERQKMYYQAKQMLQKAHTFTMVRRRRIQKVIVSKRVERTPHNGVRQIALEKHIYIASRTERIQNSEHWILTTNSERGTQQPLSQRPDFAQAKRECKRLHDELLARTQQEYRDVPRSQRMRQRKGQQFEGNEEHDFAVDPKTGWRFYRQSQGNLQTSASGSRANLQTASSSSSTWDQKQWETSNWNSQHSPSPDDW